MKLRNQSCQLILGHYTGHYKDITRTLQGHYKDITNSKAWNFFSKAWNFFLNV